MKIQGSVAIVTGGAQGIGAKICTALLDRGCKVRPLSGSSVHGANYIRVLRSQSLGYLLDNLMQQLTCLGGPSGRSLFHMKRLGVFILPPTHLYTGVETGTGESECLTQEHRALPPDRAPTRTAQSRDERGGGVGGGCDPVSGTNLEVLTKSVQHTYPVSL